MAHGKGARTRARQKRLNEKRARQAARQAIWNANKGTSRNKKKKAGGVVGESVSYSRFLMNVVVKFVNGVAIMGQRMVHGGPECGNIGCKRCSPIWRAVN